jgi:Uma2 family endonuclease
MQEERETLAQLEARLLAEAAKEVDLNRTYTLRQALRLSVPDILKHCEIVQGKILPRPSFWFGTWACEVANNFYRLMLRHTFENDLGECFCSVGVLFDNNPLAPTIRSPRISFIAKGRELTPEQQAEASKYYDYYLQLIPDLVVEFFQSDRDRWPEMQARVDQYLAGGVRLCWLVEIEERVAYVFRQGETKPTVVSYESELDATEILPDFKITLKELYERKR